MEIDELELFAAAPSESDRSCEGACEVTADVFVGSGVHKGNVIEVRPLDAQGNPVTFKGWDGKIHEQVLHIGYELALTRYLGGGNGSVGLRKVQDAIKRAVARRTETGCFTRKCRCGSLKRVKSENIRIERYQVHMPVTYNGSRYRFTFTYPVVIERTSYTGTCEDALEVHVEEHHPG